QPQVKIIPSSPQSATVFTGIAFLAKTGMSVVLRAFDGNGDLVAGPGVRNPSSITLAAGQQYAKLVSELFGLQSFDGWIEAESLATAGIPVSDAQSTLVFPLAVVGGGYSSTLSLVNIGTAPANATVTFGTASANISLPANAAARVSISDLLKLSGDTIRTGAVRVTSMSLFGVSPSLIGILDIQNSSGGASVAAKATGTDFTFPYVANANGFFTG